MVDARDAQTGIFTRAVDDMEEKCSIIQRQLQFNDDKLQKAVKLIEKTKEVLTGHEKEMAQMKVDNKIWKRESLTSL